MAALVLLNYSRKYLTICFYRLRYYIFKILFTDLIQIISSKIEGLEYIFILRELRLKTEYYQFTLRHFLKAGMSQFSSVKTLNRESLSCMHPVTTKMRNF